MVGKEYVFYCLLGKGAPSLHGPSGHIIGHRSTGYTDQVQGTVFIETFVFRIDQGLDEHRVDFLKRSEGFPLYTGFQFLFKIRNIADLFSERGRVSASSGAAELVLSFPRRWVRELLAGVMAFSRCEATEDEALSPDSGELTP